MKLIQPEPFRMRDVMDGERGHSLVIPIGRHMALRIGFQFRSWLRIGPLRYKMIATKQYVSELSNITNEPESKIIDDLEARGVDVERTDK